MKCFRVALAVVASMAIWGQAVDAGGLGFLPISHAPSCCAPKGIVQKSPLQKGVVQKGVVQKGVVQKGVVQKGIVQKGVVQKGIVQKGIVQKGIVQKGVAQKGVVQKGIVQKGCAQKGCVQKSCGLPGRPILSTLCFLHHTVKGVGEGLASVLPRNCGSPSCCAPKCAAPTCAAPVKKCYPVRCAPPACPPLQKHCAPHCCQKSCGGGCSVMGSGPSYQVVEHEDSDIAVMPPAPSMARQPQEEAQQAPASILDATIHSPAPPQSEQVQSAVITASYEVHVDEQTPQPRRQPVTLRR